MIAEHKADLIRKGVLLIIPFLLYGATLSFDYALDDALYITDNSFTKEGLGGIWDHLTKESLVGFYGEQKSLLTGGRYRPLAPITYSLEYAVYGFNPALKPFVECAALRTLVATYVQGAETALRSEALAFEYDFPGFALFCRSPPACGSSGQHKGEGSDSWADGCCGCHAYVIQVF